MQLLRSGGYFPVKLSSSACAEKCTPKTTAAILDV